MNLSGQALDNFLQEWRIQLQDELTNDPNGRLGRRYPGLAANVPTDFPDREVLDLYCHPLTSHELTTQANIWLVPGLPDTSSLSSICHRLFGWGPQILDKMMTYVWNGYFIRRLVQVKFLCLFS